MKNVLFDIKKPLNSFYISLENLRIISTLIFWAGVLLLLLVLWPIVKVEAKYAYEQMAHIRYSIDAQYDGSFDKQLTVPNKEFSIAIPKIGAVAPIIQNVDPFNKSEYLKALKKGVAQAEGSSVPIERGNVYLFAHSTDVFYNVGKYNAVFYLIDKLAKGDEIYIYYLGNKYKYIVSETKIVSANDIQYINNDTDEKILTLQTCYPPGTTYKRFIVIATQTNN